MLLTVKHYFKKAKYILIKNKLSIKKLNTERLILIPYSIKICRDILNNDFSDLNKMGLKKAKGWPDDDVMETLPKIINNLSKVKTPTGFESWMIIKNDSLEIIGDIGFKGFSNAEQNIDLGYGIIKEERRNGYAEEAARAIIKWALSNKEVKEITAKCIIENIGSINLLRKLNFVQTMQDDEMVYWVLENGEKNYLLF